MTNHHDQMSAAPDPVLAEELRQRLHVRLAGGHRDASVSITPADTDPDAQEGDLIMLETEDRPTDHEPPTPRRRSPGSWLLVAAAVAVVAILGGLLVAAGGDDEGNQVAATAPPTTAPAQDWSQAAETLVEYEPGRYSVDPDNDAKTPLRVTFEVASDGWTPWPGAFRFQSGALTGFSITTVTNLTTDACEGEGARVPPVGPTVDDLATALTQLPPFEVAAPPADVTIDGYSGKHLELTTPDLRITGPTPLPGGGDSKFTDCVDGRLYSWISPLLGGPFWGYAAVDDISEEFWILDVEGTRLVLVKVDALSSPTQDVAERDAMFDSIDIEP